VRFRLKAISADGFHGIAATGKPVATRGIDFFRVSAGRIIELYRVFDVCDYLRQLGASCP
jgi:predicted ester cyclase